MISIILFIIVLTFLILIHELGHLIVALWCKVKVEEFGIGLPPKIKTLFHWRGIPITLNWIFMGGFVRMEGEDQMQSDPKNQELRIKNQGQQLYPFYTRSLLQKLAVVAAGPFVNFAFGVIVFAGIFSIYGIPTKIYDSPILGGVAQDAPAQKAGLTKDDRIVSVAVGSESFQSISTNEAFITFINAHRGEMLRLEVQKGTERKEISVYARKIDETPEGQGALGIELRSQYEVKQYPLIERPFRGAIAGLEQSLEFGKTILQALGTIGTTVAGGKVPKDISGPVGIASQVQKEGVFSNGWVSALNFAALLSINLGVMNILPIPALDGGRIVLLILEKIVRKKQFQAVSYWLNTVGFVFLLSLLLLITLKDVVTIVLGK